MWHERILGGGGGGERKEKNGSPGIHCDSIFNTLGIIKKISMRQF